MADLDLIATYLDEVGACAQSSYADGELGRDALITRNLRLVVAVARQFQYTPLPLADLIQEGSVGLIRAAEKFDPTLGYRFSTFADESVKNAIIDALRKHKQDLSLDLSATRTASGAEDGGGFGGTLADVLHDERTPAPEDLAEQAELQGEMAEILATLNPVEQAVMRLFAAGYSAEEIAGRLTALSADETRHIKDVAIRKLAHPSRSRRLRE